jgi:hypothetical protein
MNTPRPAMLTPLTLTLCQSAVDERIKYLEKSDSASGTRELLLKLYQQAAEELLDLNDNFKAQIQTTFPGLDTKAGGND